MQKLIENKIFLIIFIMLVFSACSMKQSYVERNLYNLQLDIPTHYVKDKKKYSLVVVPVRVNAAYERPLLVYKVSGNKFLEDYYNEFISNPSRLIAENTAAYLDAYNQKYKVDYLSSLKIFDFALEIYVDSFYGDYTVNPPQAVTIIDFAVVDIRGDSSQTIYTKRFTKKKSFKDSNPSDMVQTLNSNLSDILVEFNADLNNIKF